MASPSTTRNYYEDGSGRVEYNAYNTENYLNSGDIPQPKYIGGLGDGCENKSQCHEKLYCYSGVCSHWNPIGVPVQDKSVYIQRSPYADVRMCTYREDCPGGWVCVNQTCQRPVPESQKEGFKSRYSQSSVNRQPMYTSKTKANSGKNYYLYDETR